MGGDSLNLQLIEQTVFRKGITEIHPSERFGPANVLPSLVRSFWEPAELH